MNILIPMSGPDLYQKTEGLIYPKILTEIAGKTLLEHSQSAFSKMQNTPHLIYAVPKLERKTLSLDAIIGIVTDRDATVFDVNGETGGALCTCLMALDYLDLEEELIISSADHYLDENVDEVLEYYRGKNADAGVLIFESVHPKWSYAILDEENNVKQTSEKKPISRNAMAGFFYFRKASDFIDAAKNVIRKQGQVNGQYFVSSSINEMILEGKKVVAKPLAKNGYYSFYDTHSIKVFEDFINHGHKALEEKSRDYVRAFHSRDIEVIMEFFDDSAILVDPNVELSGASAIKEFLIELFSSINNFSFIEKDIIASEDKSVIEFELSIDEKTLVGADIVRWRSGKIIALNAYLY
jgi:bifunctional N-acetylglucosamine-1-phosphate-uridyltransferase/glucosamine-1-phosphate-acetyltransferase GlmU-like protein